MTEQVLQAAARDASETVRSELERTLTELIPMGTRAALINYPNHQNVGDPALYLGSVRILHRIGVKITYRCGTDTYSRTALQGELDRGTDVILINGGGNLGDQYPQQQIREQVLRDFATVKTIQLPQSIWFQQSENLKSFAALIENHRDVTLLLRDAASVKVASENFDAPSRLAPDLAFGLGPIRRPHRPSNEIVWLRREDRESSQETWRTNGDDPIPVDWSTATPQEAVGGGAGRWLLRAHGWLSRRVAAHPWMWRPLAITYDPLAARRLAYGCRLLSNGRVVVTDRLHGVILSLLMGIPVVAVDNSTGKVSSFIDTWLAGVQSVRVAPDHQSAMALARSWLS